MMNPMDGAGPPGFNSGGSPPVPAFLQSGFPAAQPLPDPSSWELAPPPPVPKKYLDEIFQFTTAEMQAGAELVRNKLDRWNLMAKLVDGTMRLSKWNGVVEALKESSDVVENPRWQADFVVGAAPVVHSYVDRLHGDLFSTDRYYQVEQQPGITGASIEDPVYPTSQKFQALMLHDLEESFYKTRTYEILVDYATFGNAFAIPFYNRKQIMRWRRHPITGQVIPIPEDQNKLILESVPLHSVIPDIRARHSDTQRWTGVGRRIPLSFSQVIGRFRQGIYSLNEKDFARVFNEGQESLPIAYDIELWRDWALDGITTGRIKNRIVTAWEWHGEVSVSSGPARELIIVVITGRPEDDPQNGIMVRCDHGPALPTGHRPVLASHFTPMSSVFTSGGAIGPNLDLIYYMSSMLNVLIDNARLSTNVQYKVKRTGSLGLDIKARKKGHKSYPGKIWYVDNADDITPFEPLNFPAGAMQNLIQYFEHQFEKRSNVSDTTLALSQREKTATEAYTLGQMGDVPLKARLNIYVENVFQPAGRIFVGMMQSNMRGSASVPVAGRAGISTQQIITADEIRTGKYRVIASFNKTDQLSLSKAQSMERATPLLFQPGVMQALTLDGRHLSAAQWILKYLSLLGIDGLENLLPVVSPEQAQTMQMLLAVPPDQLQQLLGLIQNQQQANPQIQPGQKAQLKGPPGNGNGLSRGPDGNALGEPEAGASSLGQLIAQMSGEARARGQGMVQ